MFALTKTLQAACSIDLATKLPFASCTCGPFVCNENQSCIIQPGNGQPVCVELCPNAKTGEMCRHENVSQLCSEKSCKSIIQPCTTANQNINSCLCTMASLAVIDGSLKCSSNTTSPISSAFKSLAPGDVISLNIMVGQVFTIANLSVYGKPCIGNGAIISQSCILKFDDQYNRVCQKGHYNSGSICICEDMKDKIEYGCELDFSECGKGSYYYGGECMKIPPCTDTQVKDCGCWQVSPQSQYCNCPKGQFTGPNRICTQCPKTREYNSFYDRIGYCGCIKSYQWESISGKCVSNCGVGYYNSIDNVCMICPKTNQYSNVQQNIGTCNCVSGSTWNTTTLQCDSCVSIANENGKIVCNPSCPNPVAPTSFQIFAVGSCISITTDAKYQAIQHSDNKIYLALKCISGVTTKETCLYLNQSRLCSQGMLQFGNVCNCQNVQEVLIAACNYSVNNTETVTCLMGSYYNNDVCTEVIPPGPDDNRSGLSGGEIAAIVICSLILVGALIGIGIFFYLKNKSGKFQVSKHSEVNGPQSI